MNTSALKRIPGTILTVSREVSPDRRTNSVGKIVKNSNKRVKTESICITEASTVLQCSRVAPKRAFNNKSLLQTLKNCLQGSQNGNNKQNYWRSQEKNYQEKMAAYEQKKAVIIKDLNRISREKKKIKAKQTQQQQKQHFFVKILKQSVTDYQQTGHQQEIKNFGDCLGHQVHLQTKLRTMKAQVNSQNRRRVKEIIFTQKIPISCAWEKIMNIQFEEYQPESCAGSSISAETLAQKLIELYKQCEINWQENLCRNFSYECIRCIFNEISAQNQLQLDLRAFTREMNILFSKKYDTRELFRIFERVCPLTKGNFIHTFSK